MVRGDIGRNSVNGVSFYRRVVRVRLDLIIEARNDGGITKEIVREIKLHETSERS